MGGKLHKKKSKK